MMRNLLCKIQYYVQWNVCVSRFRRLSRNVIMPAKYYEAKAEYNQYV